MIRELRMRQRAKSAPPMLFPDQVQSVLDVATLHGKVAALPMFKQDKRTSQRAVAGSTERDRFRKWWESDEGKAWRRERAELVDRPPKKQ